MNVNLTWATSRNAHPGRQLFQFLRFRPSLLFYGFVLCLLLVSGSSLAQPLSINSSTETATAGFFQLNWSMTDAPDNTSYQLYEHADTDTSGPVLIYEGPDMASVISGKANGMYEYYVSATSSDWPDKRMSNTISVTVAHHSLRNALIVLAIGFIIFLSVIFVILRGER